MHVVSTKGADDAGSGVAHSNIGLCHGLLGDYSTAAKHHQEALRVALRVQVSYDVLRCTSKYYYSICVVNRLESLRSRFYLSPFEVVPKLLPQDKCRRGLSFHGGLVVAVVLCLFAISVACGWLLI